MRKLTVLIDMDDTIENFCEVWVDLINENNGTNVSMDDINEWDISKAFPTLTKDKIYTHLLSKDLWGRVAPLPGAVETIKQIIDDGHKVIIVTASDPRTVSMKLELVLFKYFPYLTYEDVIITSQKQCVLGDVLIDDAPHNLIGGQYFPILMTAHHNMGYDASSNGFLRVNNWKEAYQAIKMLGAVHENVLVRNMVF